MKSLQILQAIKKSKRVKTFADNSPLNGSLKLDTMLDHIKLRDNLSTTNTLSISFKYTVHVFVCVGVVYVQFCRLESFMLLHTQSN